MPYKIVKNHPDCPKSKPYAVVNKDTGKKYGCHTTSKKAGGQMMILRRETGEKSMKVDEFGELLETQDWSEGDDVIAQLSVSSETEPIEDSANTDGVPEKEKDSDKKKEAKYIDGLGYIPMGVTSFAELEAVADAAEVAKEIRMKAFAFPEIVSNIMWNQEIEDKMAAVRSLSLEFADSVEKTFDEVNKEKANSGFVSKVKDAVQSILKLKPKEPTVKGGFMVYKDAEGDYKWIARYSNNIRDNDTPPEIIASESHKRFVGLVDSKEAELPELWLWHEPTLKVGKSVWVAYDEENGFALAAGYFYDWAYSVAEALDKTAESLAVSHGMPTDSIKRSKEDPTIIVEHITEEISPLVFYAAANKWTGFAVIDKEVKMIDAKKRTALVDEMGISEGDIDKIVALNSEQSKQADEQGLDKKEADAETSDTEDKVSEDEPKEKDAPKSAFSDEQLAELKDAFATFGDTLTTRIEAQVAEIKEAIAPVKEKVDELEASDSEKISKKLEATPAASLAEILTAVAAQKESALASDATKIDGRTKLAKQKPAENKSDLDTYEFVSGDPIKNMLVGGVLNRDELFPVETE